MAAFDSVLKQISNSDCQKVKVAVTDMDGVLRGKYMHRDKFLSAAANGFGFCNVVLGWDCHDVCYDDVQYTGWHTGYPDALTRIDLSTHRKVPFDHNVDFFLAEFVDDKDQSLSLCPRGLLKTQQEKAKELGLSCTMGMEFEWFNFRETSQSLADKNFVKPNPLTPGMFGYSLLRSGQNRDFIHQIIDDLAKMNIAIEGIHTETGPGVYEAAILYASAVEAADRAVIFKSAVKEIAMQYGIIASFMARWNDELPGCSGHIHQSLQNIDGGKNAFFDANDTHKMSATFKHYLAGLLHCLPELLPMLAPNVNSYKRLVEGFWAPTSASWSIDNRTSSLRVIPGSEKSTRLEVRVGGADMNPYLSAAACLGAGLYGIKNKLELKVPAVQGNAYEASSGRKFAKTLQEATEVMKNSKVAREIFDEKFVEHFVASREWEWLQFQNAVTDWEMKRYFEII